MGGANKSAVLTPAELAKIGQGLCDLSKEACPKTTNEWIKWMGAKKVTAKECNAYIANLKKILPEINKAAKVADKATEKLKKCASMRCNIVIEDPGGFATCAAIRCGKESTNLREKNAAWRKIISKQKRL